MPDENTITLTITMDIDLSRTHLTKETYQNNIVDFTTDLLNCGAYEEDMDITLREINYKI